MAKELNTSVLIVGAGPTGLMAANQLMRFGVDFIIIDHKDGPTIESRAIAVTARSLEIYQQMGLVRHAVENGKLMKSFNLYFQGKKKAEVKIGEIGKGLSEFSYMLGFEQSKNELLLANNLLNNGQNIHWNYEFVRLNEYKDKINATVKNRDEEVEINAEYLIACDGASSPVRTQLNFSFKGGTYDHKFFVADVILNWNHSYDTLIIFPGDKNFCAFLPLNGDAGYRIIGTLPLEFANSSEITFREIESVVKKTVAIPVNFESVNWFSTYKLHHRCVDHFMEGRVFLAGDSAHIHSPAGGQGMNTGLQDAYNLCWKLALVLNNQAKATLLETYNEERLPFARWLLQFTDRGFSMMTSTSWFTKLFRKYFALKLVGIVLRNNFIRPIIFKTISQIGYSYNGRSLSKISSKQSLKFKAGDRLPYFPEANIYHLFKSPSFHLLHLNSGPLDEINRTKVKGTFPFDVKVIECEITKDWQSLGVKSELFILVRPDNYMSLISDSLDTMEIETYLKKNFI